MKTYNVLIADDEAPVRKIVARICRELEWTSDLASNGVEALELMEKQPHQIFVVDVRMPGPSGIALARKILEYEEAPAILIMTGYGELEKAIQATKEGIFDYIQKDSLAIDSLKHHLQRAAEYHENLLLSIQSRQEREKEIHDIEIANKQFQSILELSSDLIFILDARSGQIMDSNAAACKRLGYKRKELSALHYSDVDDDRSESLWEEIRQEISIERSSIIERIFRKNDGSTLPVEISFAYVCLETGEFVSVVARDVTERKQYYKRLKATLVQTIQMVASTVEIRDPYTAGHQKRMAQLSIAIAGEMGLKEERIEGIYLGGLIHDVGKIGVPSEVLNKPGRLFEEEFSLIKLHTQLGYDIVKDIESSWPISQMVYQHHERINGSGYPQGLSNGDILQEARILCVADVVEAMASHRPYRPSLGIEKALEEISINKGVLYDPIVADACMNLFEENKFQWE